MKDADPAAVLVAQAQSILAQGGSQDDARHLALLAADLGKSPGKNTPTVTPPRLTLTPTFSPTSTSTQTVSTATLQPSLTLTPTETASMPVAPTRTPIPTLSAPFILKERRQVCDPSLPEGLLQVQVTGAAGQPLPGVEIRVTWQGGEDFFFTGLKPELGVGYADFGMTAGKTYAAQLAAGSQIASNLNVPDCSRPGGANYWGGWLLTFSQ